MTHQNHQTNGASLEDCHTNFFALTELFGIKWRKLVWGERGGADAGGAPLEDPVISSYARCLAGDILCVWRRVPQPPPPADLYELPAPAPPPPLSLRAAKELWIFWYGEEPDLNGLVAPELLASQGDQGSWESGLTYECRSLLFKALHNLIERCLLSRDFVRLGKWFVQPYDGDEEDVGKSPWHLSFSFAFFLHGESTVCASVDVRQHPPVRTLAANRPTSADPGEPTSVILAPFGLEGTLTGREWSDTDPETGRLLDAWRHLYPLEKPSQAVEVICGGVRMRYPRAYVLRTMPGAHGSGASTPTSPHPPLAHRALHALRTPKPHQPAEICYADAAGDKSEDYVDFTKKSTCTCAKWRRRRGPRPPPFHRRAPPHAPPPTPAPASGATGVCGSPGSAAASPAPGVSAPPSCGAAPVSPPPPPQQTLQSACPPTTLHTPAPTPDPLAPATPAPPSAPSTRLHQGDSPVSGGVEQLARRPVLAAGAAPAQPPLTPPALRMLYDYSSVSAWLEHPVKRFKPSEPVFKEELALGCTDEDLYSGQEHIVQAALAIKPERLDEDTKEYKNLFTSDGLCPTLKDLDQIFDNSDEASGDETATLLASGLTETKCLEERCGGGGRCVRAEELSKMFPTPPSLEPHAAASPTLPPDEPVSPPPQAIDDWSYVFKPPQLARCVGSAKYAPLPVLPSQTMPRLPLPPEAVYRPRWQAPAAPPDQAPAAAAATNRAETKPSNPPSVETREVAPTRTNGPVAPSLPQQPPAAACGAACPLLLNVLLGDTALNVFRDHNFNSCTLCVCNAGGRVVGNIRGADYALLPGGGAGGADCDEDPPRCTCGFSSVVNRRLAHQAGLFYEDEMEITGCATVLGSDSAGGGLAGVASAVLASLDAGAASALYRAARRAARAAPVPTLHALDHADAAEYAARALRAAGARPNGTAAAHRWAHLSARAPRSSRDVVRLMRRLRPLLQDAIQKRCCGARMWDGVSGPLTWRQFHRLAGRGNEDPCEPQPVPHLLVGHERDWLSLSPYALQHWARLQLEPYGYARDVLYVVLAPPEPAAAPPLNAFLQALGAAYEACRLGRHRPLRRVAPGGTVRAPPAPDAAADWVGPLPPGRLGAALRGYAEALRGLLPQLAALSLERALLEDEDEVADESEAGPASLVLYVVEPPAAAAAPQATLAALLRLADRATDHLAQHNPLVKILSLEGVQEWWSGGGDAARALAFSVYGACRRATKAAPKPRSLTGFGPCAAAARVTLAPTKLGAPAYVLGTRRAAEWGGGRDAPPVLFVAYCLSHDQRTLLAAVTDAHGELTDTIAINIHVPHRSRRRRSGPARRLGLTKLMDFTLGVMSASAQPWRLVVGRVGRIGHGELKGWSWLLSRKNLVRASAALREMCGACAALGGLACSVQSACLVSTEPEWALRLMADRFTPDERFATVSALHTPRDVTATHILVFPTSATTTSAQPSFDPPAAGEDTDMNFLGVDMEDEDMGEDNMTDLLIGDLMFTNMWGAQTSPRRDEHDHDHQAPQSAQPPTDANQEQVGTVLQQPLALGYLVSTAPLGAMPAWWWTGCGHLRDACPAFLKTALHLHAASVHSNDDLGLTSAPNKHVHPLDSPTTTDVLRYVLERYNALSWLALDPATSDRRSCLPLHVQLLLDLYHTAHALA